MASHPSSNSDTPQYPDLETSDPGSRSTIVNYGSIPVDADVIYADGQLSWAEGNQTIRDEDVIVITPSIEERREEEEVGRGGNQYTIWSLLAPSPAADSVPNSSPPFELRSTRTGSLPSEFLERYLFRKLPAHLDPEENGLYVLISTLSGTGLAPSFYDEVLRPVLTAVGLKEDKYEVVRTSSAESVIGFARSVLLVRADEGRRQTVLMLSGDGGVVDTINGLLGSGSRSSKYTKPTLSQLPLGTGNALFHSIHRPSTLPSIYIQGLRTLLHGTPKPLPIFRATFSPGARLLTNEGRTATPVTKNTLHGAVVASYGLHATLVADSDTTAYRKHGDKRFGLVAKDLLFPADGADPHAYRASVTLLLPSGNERVIERSEHGYVLATPVSNLERRFSISPASRPLDGELRVVYFGPMGGEGTMGVMQGAYDNGKHVGMEGVGYETISGLRIGFREEGEGWGWRRCCVDGLIVGVEEGGWMEVRMVEKGGEAVEIVVDV